VPTSSTPSPGAVASLDPDAVECRVIDGVDPNPGDGYDENGSNIRGEQNIGRSGGRGSTTPEEEVGGHVPASPLEGIVSSLLNARRL
jgi:phospholipid/cholesterol/gamma-HCH transport system substrate-binding protein